MQKAQLSCVLFRGEKVSFRDQIAQGVRLILSGDVSVYMPRGQYQMIVRGIELDGIGSLQMAFERLKAKLQEEGLFDASRRESSLSLSGNHRPGDIREWGCLEGRDSHVLAVTRAQGATGRLPGSGARASSDIARSIDRLNRWHASQPSGKRPGHDSADSGSSSLEDLWAFNEEGETGHCLQHDSHDLCHWSRN